MSSSGETLLLRLLSSLSLRSGAVRSAGSGRVLGTGGERGRSLVSGSGSELSVSIVEALIETELSVSKLTEK